MVDESVTTHVCPLNRGERCQAYPAVSKGKFHRMACIDDDCPLTIKTASSETTSKVVVCDLCGSTDGECLKMDDKLHICQVDANLWYMDLAMLREDMERSDADS